MTLQTTAALKFVPLKGRLPVRTYQEVNPMLLRVDVRTHFKDSHPDRIDIRTLGRKLFRRPSGKSKFLGVHEFWCHPPGRTLQFTASRFLNNDRQPKVRHAGTIIRVHQDVGLGAVISIDDAFGIDEVLTPLMSP